MLCSQGPQQPLSLQGSRRVFKAWWNAAPGRMTMLLGPAPTLKGGLTAAGSSAYWGWWLASSDPGGA